MTIPVYFLSELPLLGLNEIALALDGSDQPDYWVGTPNGNQKLSMTLASVTSELPPQSGQGGKFLTTDGSDNLSWAAAGGGSSSLWLTPVNYATTVDFGSFTPVTETYTPLGNQGIGDTLQITNSASQYPGWNGIDGAAFLVVNQRVLLAGQTTSQQNGIYSVTSSTNVYWSGIGDTPYNNTNQNGTQTIDGVTVTQVAQAFRQRSNTTLVNAQAYISSVSGGTVTVGIYDNTGAGGSPGALIGTSGTFTIPALSGQTFEFAGNSGTGFSATVSVNQNCYLVITGSNVTIGTDNTGSGMWINSGGTWSVVPGTGLTAAVSDGGAISEITSGINILLTRATDADHNLIANLTVEALSGSANSGAIFQLAAAAADLGTDPESWSVAFQAASASQTANNSLSNLSSPTLNVALNMNGNQINNMADPSNPQDAATMNYVDNQAGAVSGATGSRPATSVVGFEFFDTTLGYPVWWNGTAWVNASGTPS
jgi:hypothetical protein